jgi:hypothetical protein
MIARALVIESHLSSRRELVRDIAELHLAEDVIEADSVRDALSRLATDPLHACVLGPRLQPSTALGLVAEAKSFSIQKNCAFLAVASNKNNIADSALGQLVDGTIGYPYSKSTFSEIVRGAIERAQHIHSGPSSQQVASIDCDLLSDALSALASDLHRISKKITSGTFRTDRSGAPSAEISHEIRRVLERLPLTRTESGKLSGSDDFFVRSVAAWFSDRTRTSHQSASRTLIDRLTSF